MKRLFKGIVDIFRGTEQDEEEFEFFDEEELEFREKVKRVMKGERDFSILYDVNAIINMSDREQAEYLSNITKRYLVAKELVLRGEENS